MDHTAASPFLGLPGPSIPVRVEPVTLPAPAREPSAPVEAPEPVPAAPVEEPVPA